MAAKTVHLLSLGCAKNRVDSEVMLGHLVEHGYRPVPNAADADVIIVNTCGFIKDAKQESVDSILEMATHRREGRAERLVVTGCLSQLFAPELAKEIPEIDHFLGAGNFERIVAVLKQAPANPKRRHTVKAFPDPDFTLTNASPRVLSLPYSAYVKIAEGCSNQCTFCIVPKVRGPQHSRTLADVVAEAEKLLESGVVELNLIAQDLCAFGKDRAPKESLSQLLRALDRLETSGATRFWVRCLYLYPRGLTRGVTEALAEGRHIVPYLDIPLQHVADGILRRMKRGKGGKATWELVRRLRRDIPGVTLRTTFITGFPGETEGDFSELCDLVREIEFEHLGVFAFSPEEGTPAAALSSQVAPELALERRHRLLELQRGISRRQQERLVGKRLRVLVEGVSDETDLLWQGRHAGQAPEVDGVTYITDGKPRQGELVEVLITQADDYDVAGGIITA